MTILRYVLFTLAVLIAAAFGWRAAGGPSWVRALRTPPALGRADGPPPKPAASSAAPASVTPSDARAAILKRLDEIPQFAAFYKDLAAGFPHTYSNLLADAARRLAEGGAAPSAGALFWEALRDLRQSDGILAAGADEPSLASFFDARRSMLDGLADVDQRVCADFLYGAADESIEAFSLTHPDLVADLARKQVAAIENGRRKHLDPRPPSPEDLDLVASGLAARKIEPDEISMLLDGKSLDPPPPDARLCAIGRTYLSVLKDLAPDVRQRIYGLTAQLLARS